MSVEFVILGFLILFFCLIFVAIIYSFYEIFIASKSRYQKTDYYNQTHKKFWDLQFDKGSQGEYLLWDSLQQLPGYKKFLFNCYLPKENGETTEIDLILLHESGIYVFESKNYSGWIFGTETQQYWVQSLPGRYGQAHKVKFFNPILQNKVHLKWLARYLERSPSAFYSYIIFGDECTLKDITLTSGQHCVVNRSNILSSLSAQIQLSSVKLTTAEIDTLYQKLFPLTQLDEAQKLVHIQEVQAKKESVDGPKISQPLPQQEPSGTCPLCGGRLVLRTATRGPNAGNQFWGCSNYPKCRYIRDIPSGYNGKPSLQ